ncbi:hypothetical protein H0H81_002698 [Sphagnurus paluster]|uniref:Retrotransposon gag domain-containing protein n=1 Tax=Sphagnurus paluster TaxID=117069 RepID=A0A9P7FNH7_9AGAR|nr:hypothetical protein H0H81_002698 [Sphagnurus paluster]
MRMQRKRRSLNEKDRLELAKNLFPQPRELTEEQTNAVDTAVNTLTEKEKEKIARRDEAVATKTRKRRNSSVSKGEGPCEPKGKGIDPKEFGNLDLNDAEADVELQTAALETFQDAKRNKKSAKNQVKNSTTKQSAEKLNADRRSVRPEKTSSKNKVLPDTVRLTAQINPKSILGTALKEAEKIGSSKRRNSAKRSHPSTSGSSSSSESDSSSDSSDSESSSSSSSSDSSSDESSSSNSSSNKKSKKRKSKKSKKRRSKDKLDSKNTFKPVKYNGQAVLTDYHRFIREATFYAKKIPKEDRIIVLSHYLDGKAYEFYNLKVASKENKWSLKDFFAGIFDYCFPVNYRMQMRQKLHHCHQNGRTVEQYAHELEQLFEIIGVKNKREKVIKLWYGLRQSLREALWCYELNPEVSTWDEVLSKALIVEISRSDGNGHERREGTVSLNRGEQPWNGGRSSNLKSSKWDRNSNFNSKNRDNQNRSRYANNGPSRLR